MVQRRMSLSMSVSVRARQRPCGAQRGGRRAHPDARRRGCTVAMAAAHQHAGRGDQHRFAGRGEDLEVATATVTTATALATTLGTILAITALAPATLASATSIPRRVAVTTPSLPPPWPAMRRRRHHKARRRRCLDRHHQARCRGGRHRRPGCRKTLA